MPNGDRKVTAQFVANGARHEIDLDANVVGAVVFDREDLRRAQKAQELATNAAVDSTRFALETFQPGNVEDGVLDVRSGPDEGLADESVWWHVVTSCKWFHAPEPPPE